MQKFENLAASGLTLEEIARAIGIGTATLYEKKNEYPEILEAIKNGKARANAIVHNALMILIQGVKVKDKNGVIYTRPPDLGSIVWYEKSRRGMTDKLALDHSGSVSANIDFAKLSPEALEKIVEAGQTLKDAANGNGDRDSD